MAYDVFHALYLYLLAVKDGQLGPLLDFIIDGKYDKNFEQKVKPNFKYKTYEEVEDKKEEKLFL